MLFLRPPSIRLGPWRLPEWREKKGYLWLGRLSDGTPIPWRLLSRQGNGGVCRDAAGREQTAPLFLLCGMTLGTFRTNDEIRKDFTIPFHTEKNACEPECPASVWRESHARAWCAKFGADCLSVGERAALLATYKDDGTYQIRWYPQQPPVPAAPGILNGDRIFFLSDEEAENTAYGFTIRNNRTAGKEWWTRSYEKTDAALGYRTAGIVITNSGGLLSAPISPSTTMYARPAINLDPAQVLLVSAAGMKKPEAFAKVPPFRGPAEWKLTLLDGARPLLSLGPPRREGARLTVPYENALCGEREHISALVLDHKGRILYYGSAARPRAPSGEAVLQNLPPMKNRRLFLFPEQRNEPKQTDYAGPFKEISLPD